MPSFAASLESLLVFVVIVLLSALSSWLKQRQEKRQQAEPHQRRGTMPGTPSVPPPLPPPPREPEATDWERELRRLFGEEPEPPPPRPRPVAPPPLAEPVAEPPSQRPEPVLARSTQPAPGTSEPEFKPAALPPGTHFAPAAEALDAEEAPEFVLAPLGESASALQRANQGQEDAIARVHRASALTAQHAPTKEGPRHSRVSPEIARVRAQLRHPRTAREVILATVLLGPPRALDPGR